MNSEINNSYSKSYKLKKAVITYGTLIWAIGGLIAGAFARENFTNYNSPYLFGLTFLLFGVLIGIFVAKKLKAKIVINRKIKETYDMYTFKIVCGFFGLSWLLGVYANELLSTKVKCDNYTIAEKFIKDRRKGGDDYILGFNVDGVYHRYSTRSKYWKTISVDQKVNICTYKSKIGFDFIILTDEQ